MFKKLDDTKKFSDDIPMNSPEYLKRFQCSFNPMYIKNSSQVVNKKGAITSSSLAMSSIKATSGKSGRLLKGSGSGLSSGSGSGKFFGFGYGIDLI